MTEFIPGDTSSQSKDIVSLETSQVRSLTVQDELWRIFTFYTLNNDSTQPEHMKLSNFIKFAKDVQIVSTRFTSTQIELELAHILRGLRKGDIRVGAVSLTFTEFLLVLEALSTKIYPNNPIDVACRRLLLENVLLLAGRRNESHGYDLKNPQVLALVDTTLSKGIESIFRNYVAINEMHYTARLQELDLTPKESRAKVKEMKDKITFQEFMQFCIDFNLKSPTLLTGMQVGHVFLTMVPLDNNSKATKGMDYDMFRDSMIHLSQLAYRNIPDVHMNSLTKIKAMFLHMWKTINKPENILKAKSNAPIWQPAAFRDLHGSANFSDIFLKLWQEDGFIDYQQGPDQDSLIVGSDVVEKIAESGSIEAALQSGKIEGGDSKALLGSPSKAAAAELPLNAGSMVLSNLVLSVNEPTNNNKKKMMSNHTNVKNNSSNKTPDLVKIKGNDLVELLRRQPELMELLLLEIKNNDSRR